MKLGEDIVVKGKMSERLFYNITQYYMHMVSAINPDLSKVAIQPALLGKAVGLPTPGAVVTGFAAGVVAADPGES